MRRTEQVALRLGAATAQSWANAIAIPPPTLPNKLGVSKATRVLWLGEPKSIELEAVLEQAGAINEGNPNLVLAYVTTPAEVHAAMEQWNNP